MTGFHVYITTNSPGELTSWVRPISHLFKQLCANCTIIVLLVPCQYASGQEETVARAIPWVDEVWSVQKTIRTLLKKIARPEKGAVLYLGGDPFYAKVWAKKLGVSAYGYTEHNHTLSGFKHTFKLSEVGNLMGDHVQLSATKDPEAIRKDLGFLENPIVFFSGSRPQHFEKLFPFFCEVISALQTRNPSRTFVIQLSPFLNPELVNRVFERSKTENIRIVKAPSLDILKIAKLVVTIPGTNTAEAMFLHTPMIVMMPLNYPQLIILDGLLGIIDKIPFLGYPIKWLALKILKRRITFLSHPNRLAQAPLVPEWIEVFESHSFIQKIQHYLDHPELIENIRLNLSQLTHKQGVANHIVTKILHEENAPNT